jgi:hypothetical protein
MIDIENYKLTVEWSDGGDGGEEETNDKQDWTIIVFLDDVCSARVKDDGLIDGWSNTFLTTLILFYFKIIRDHYFYITWVTQHWFSSFIL